MTPKRTNDELLEQIAQDLREMKVELFGKADVETPNGRIPRLERKVSEHHRRLTALERYRWYLAGAIALAVFYFEYIEAAKHL